MTFQYDGLQSRERVQIQRTTVHSVLRNRHFGELLAIYPSHKRSTPTDDLQRTVVLVHHVQLQCLQLGQFYTESTHTQHTLEGQLGKAIEALLAELDRL